MSVKNAFSVRRIVTGENDQGKSYIEIDENSPYVTYLSKDGGAACADIWNTTGCPSTARAPATLSTPTKLAPPPEGSVFRVVRFPPDSDMAEGETGLPHDDSASEAEQGQDKTIHPQMHKTMSVDYAIVLSGEIYAVMETEEVRMLPGDVLVQRATGHAWANRSNEPCTMAFVLIEASDK